MAPAFVESSPPPIQPKPLRPKFRIGEWKSTTKVENIRNATDIEYEPNYEKYIARSASRQAAGGLSTTVPDGWPTLLKSPLAWDGSQFSDERSYVYYLSDSDKTEILSALRHFKGFVSQSESLHTSCSNAWSDLELDGSDVNTTNFPLPKLGNHLDKLAVDLHNGKGFFIIRGLDPQDYSAGDNVLVLLGISSYIAPRRGRQDQIGNMLSKTTVFENLGLLSNQNRLLVHILDSGSLFSNGRFLPKKESISEQVLYNKPPSQSLIFMS
jgi:hypothetical protein